MLQSLAPARARAARLEACLNPENLGFVADLYATSDAELVADAPHDPAAVEAYEAPVQQSRAAWEAAAAEDSEGLEDAVARAIIGDRPLHEAQRAILDHLRQGRSVLGVMATGRGKSLTFQVHAAVRALRGTRPACSCTRCARSSPTRRSTCARRWTASASRVAVLTGESTPEERRQAFAGLADGAVDIALTTPEFLAWHAEEFARRGRVRFVVVDEAHHIGLARAGQRPALRRHRRRPWRS